MNLEEALEVQVRHLILVADTEELGERGVGEDAALERGVKARMRLDVLADELRHLGLRTGLTGLEAHEVAELIRERALDEEGIVRAALLVGRTLLGRHRRRVNLLLLLGVAGLTLGSLRGLLDGADGIADTGREIRAERLERLGECGELNLRGNCRGGNSRLSGRGRDRRDGHLHLRGGRGLGGLGLGLGLHLGLSGLGCGSCNSNRGGGGNGLRGIGLLGGRHLV